MNVTIDRIKLTFLGLFVLACAGIFAYHYIYVWPKQRCEARGDWWDDQDRVCAVPMPIWSFTHRMPGQAQPTAAHAKAAANSSRPSANSLAARPKSAAPAAR